MARLDPTLSVFTSTHLLYLRLCMESRSSQEAIILLKHNTYTFPSRNVQGIEMPPPCSSDLTPGEYITARSELSAEIRPADVHEYFVLGSMIYIGAKDYERALLLLEHVLLAPSRDVATGLMLEAFRKWLLVSLLVTGQVIDAILTLFVRNADG